MKKEYEVDCYQNGELLERHIAKTEKQALNLGEKMSKTHSFVEIVEVWYDEVEFSTGDGTWKDYEMGRVIKSWTR